MCGIFGIVGRPADGDDEAMRAMGERLAHRGPDDGATRRSSLGIMGVRRLAIVDPRGSEQPVRNEDDTIQLTLNGEIYNFRELRRRLVDRGHAFATNGDAETIVHAYEEHGLECVCGICAACSRSRSSDQARGRVVLARDHLGKKPLYYTLRGDRLIYASELKALFADGSPTPPIDRRSLRHYLTFKHVPSPRTIFEGIFQLASGTLAIHERGELSVQRYWRPRFTGDARIDEQEAEERLVELLRDAVRVRMAASDVPIGASLSGGLDSSLVVALMAECGAARLKTFSLGYEPRVEHKRDAEFARAVARRFGTLHHEETISTSEIAAELPRVLEAFDEPFAGTITSFWLSRVIGSHVKVAFSGDGADELFGSYAAHRHAAALHANGTSDAEEFGLWRTRFAAFTDAEKDELLVADDVPRDDDSATLLGALFAQSASGDIVNATLEVDCRTLACADQVLTYADRLLDGCIRWKCARRSWIEPSWTSSARFPRTTRSPRTRPSVCCEASRAASCRQASSTGRRKVSSSRWIRGWAMSWRPCCATCSRPRGCVTGSSPPRSSSAWSASISRRYATIPRSCGP